MRIVVLLGLLLIAATASAAKLAAQTEPGAWQQPVQLFETDGRASEAEVVADPSGVVHVFWAYGAPGAEESGEGQAIYYARLDNGRWSAPVDILVSPGGRAARMHAVVADRAGYLHIVWSGGNALFYSRAFAPDAGTALAWSEPITLVSGPSALEPGLAVDGAGVLYVVWTQAATGLMFSQSDDGGRSWSIPQVIFPAGAGNQLARWGRIAVDERGRLHVALTYTERVESGAEGLSDPNYLYYLRSEDGGESWSTPVLPTPEPDFGEMNVATYGQDVVHLVWNGRAGRHGRYHRWSEDGGQTWSDVQEVVGPAPSDPIGTGGLTGFPALAVDSTGTLHMVSASSDADHYFRWQDGSWSEPTLISPGLRGDGVTGEAISLEQPSIAINRGSELHVAFHDGFERIWQVMGTTGLPEEPVVSLAAEPPPEPGVAPAAPAESDAGSPATAPLDAEPASGLSGVAVIGLASLPAILLIVVVVLARRPRR